jgi:hypothetical protein
MSKTGVWIPIEIWRLSELTLLERYIYSDIYSFNKVGRVYFKTNSKLAEECNCSNASITRAISNLIKLDHIKVKQSSPVRKLVPNQIDEAPKQIDEAPNQIDEPPNQIEEPPRQIDEHISKVISKGISKRINKVIKEDVVFPFQEKEFLDTWKIWIEERRESGIKKYTNRGEQSALHKLQKISNHDYRTAIAIINESISQGWRGLFALKRDKQQGLPDLSIEDAVRWADNIR